jgi:PAS domain S-box-containing protein
MALKAHWPTGAPLNLTVSPIRGPDNRKAGCFILIRESADLLAHPVMAQQMATLSSILENFPMPFFMVDPFLVVTHLNEHMEKLTGYTRDEVVGQMTCGELLNTVQCFTNDCILKQVMLHKKAFSGERRVVRTRNGREVPVTVSASIITDPEGRVIGGFEALRDITPVVEAEQKLDLLTQLTREGLLMADENHRIIFANTRMMEILNIPRSRIIGMHLGEVLTSQHLHMAQELANLVDGGNLQQETQFCSILDKTKRSQVPGSLRPAWRSPAWGIRSSPVCTCGTSPAAFSSNGNSRRPMPFSPTSSRTRWTASWWWTPRGCP